MHAFRQLMRLVESEPAKVINQPVTGVWYHGTPYAFDQFDAMAGEHDSNHETPAIFLTNDPDLAESYASREREPIGGDVGYGAIKKQFIIPAENLIASSQSVASSYLSRSAESILNGRIDFEKALEELSDIAVPLRQLKHKYDALQKAQHTTAGANIRPCTVSGTYMHVKMLTDFNAAFYDLFMRRGLEAGLAGVLFHDIVDSPSGGGHPADVLAVFDGQNIHPKFGFIKGFARSG